MGFCALFYTGKPNRRLTDSNMKGLIRSKLIAAMLTASLLMTHAGAYVSAEEAGAGSEVQVAETTAPETSAPETSAPETSAPETSAPETSAPETSAPETSAPETSAPETTVPEKTTESTEPSAEGSEK